MAFFIDTDVVTPISDNIKEVASKASQVVDSVNGYSIDTTEFDFSGAKNAIANNVEGMKIKMKNSSTLLNAVVGTHEGYQKSADGGGDGNTSSSSNSYSSGNSSYGSSSSSYYGGGGGYGSGGLATTVAGVTTASGGTVGDIKADKIATTEEQSLLVASMLGNDVKSNIILSTLANTMNLYNIGLIEKNKLADTLKANPKLVIIEGVSTAIETIEYTRIVGKVCGEYSIPVKYVNLDKILSYKDSETDKKTAAVNATDTESSLTNKDDKEKTESTETKETTDTKETADTKDKKDSKNTEEEKVNYEIKDKEAFKELESLSFKKGVKNDLTSTPVTLMVKDNSVVGSLNDVATEEQLKAALKAAGLIA